MLMSKSKIFFKNRYLNLNFVLKLTQKGFDASKLLCNATKRDMMYLSGQMEGKIKARRMADVATFWDLLAALFNLELNYLLAQYLHVAYISSRCLLSHQLFIKVSVDIKKLSFLVRIDIEEQILIFSTYKTYFLGNIDMILSQLK